MHERTWWRFLVVSAAAFLISLPLGLDALTLVALLIAIAAVAAVFIGIHTWQPANRIPWYWLAGSASLFILAPIVAELQKALNPATGVGSDVVSGSGPPLSDIINGAAYVAGIYAVHRMVQKRQRGLDPTNLLDSLIAMSGVAVLAWVLIIVPYLTAPNIAFGDRLAEGIFSLEALVLATYVARLAIGPGARNAAYYLLACAVFGLFGLEILYAVELGLGHNLPGHDVLLLVLNVVDFVTFGAAVLHPSMAQLAEPATEPVARMTARRLGMMAGAALTPPIVLAVRSSSSLETSVVIACWGVISVMVMIRMAGLVRARERAQALELTLSHAAAGLVAATMTSEMHETALETALLLAKGRDTRASVLTADGGVWRVAAASGAPGATRSSFSLAEVDPEVHHALTRQHATTLTDVVPPDLEGGSRACVVIVPLISRNILTGGLVVSSSTLIDIQLVDAITSLGTNLALALQSASLAEEMYRQRNERRFRVLSENSDDIVAVLDPSGRTSFITPAASRLLGYDDSELARLRFRDLLVIEDVSKFETMIASPEPKQAPREFQMRDGSGGLHWVEIVIADLSADPEIGGIVVTAREISDRKAAELRLAKSEARFRALVQHSSDIVAVIDSQGMLTYVSGSVSRVLGYRVEQLIDRELLSVVHPDDQARFGNVLRRIETSTSDTATTELRVCGSDHQWRTLDVTVTDLTEDTSVRGIVVNAHDVTDRKQLEQDLRHQALHDGLTGLPNRVLFRDRVSQALARRQVGSVAVLMIDLDDFKTINDAVGHPVGDETLKTIAFRLRQFLRAADTAARLGGDEFAIVIENVHDREEILEIARRLLVSLRAPMSWSNREIRVDASIGIVFDTDCPTPTPEIMLRNADMAMYSAKGKGKGRVAVYDESMHVGVFERLELKADLARAIDNKELLLYYQPIVELRTARVVGFEALTRWRHHDRGMISPGSFIPLAEETGAIVPLGRWLMNTAFTQLAHWQQQFPGPRPLSMSVNLSPRQLEDPAIAHDIRYALERHNLDPSSVTMELTEGSLVDGGSIRHDRLAEIRALGVNIVADDFGSGYASYAAVGQLPFTGVKIDRSLVSGVADDESAKAVAQVRAIIDFTRETGLSAVAEGIEAGAQVSVLVSLGCTHGQGFYYSPPVPAEDAEAALRESSLTSAN